MRLHFLWIFILLLSCQPETTTRSLEGSDLNVSNNQGSSNGGSGQSGNSSTPGSQSPSESDIYFYNTNYHTQLTINSNINDTLYLRGPKVEEFLLDSSAFQAKYCLVVNFRDLLISGVATNLQLRTRAVPTSIYNFSEAREEKFFRLELHDKVASSQSCQGAVVLDNPNSSSPTTFTHLTSKFLISELCPTCLGVINSDEIYLYHSNGTSLGNRVEHQSLTENFLNLSSLSIVVNYNNNTSNQNPTCSDLECQSQGFDCCSEGQCVNDGAQKSSANTSDSAFQTALQEVLSQPSAYRNYPEYFYICSGTRAPSTDEDEGDPEADALALLESLKADKVCIDELVNDSLTSPYTLNYISPASYPATLDPTKCSTTSSDTLYVQSVLDRLYTKCGCSETNFSNKVNNCPAYKYKITKTDSQGNILAIGCDVPEVDNGPEPFQDLDIELNSRTVPHRYFKRTSGEAVDDLSKFFLDSSFTYEGEDFSYLDGPNRMIPVNSSFNMNSILGAMETTLDKSLPAKMVSVNRGVSYLIETRSGFYETCKNCARDSWLNAFSAYPSSQFGIGVQAIGHTTSRDQYVTNTTFGNYADTHFGRACYIPPTMVPYSHSSDASSITQRQNRLKTQTALYVNGYQKDWFGFNRGAVIGSFDGVTWFAIGKGRLITATTNKLFLAINAPFGDLAENNTHIIGVSEYTPPATAAIFDYDPNLTTSAPLQNEAASCQKYHQCSVDSDCVTQLGWEYVCADVSKTRMYKPSFSSDADEVANSAQSVSFKNWIAGSTFPGSSTKRCVYRGAGSVCRRDYEGISGANEKRKLLTCAPNFYCANPNSSVFNTEVARFVGDISALPLGDGNYYGMDADFPGRPLHYVTGVGLTSLPADVQSNLEANMNLNDSSASWGVCRPGKYLSAFHQNIQNAQGEITPLKTHQTADSSYRTDYISQIGNCDATFNSGWTKTHPLEIDYDPTDGSGWVTGGRTPAYLSLSAKHMNCPVFDSDGNYLQTKESFTTLLQSATESNRLLALTDYAQKSNRQNACGLESLDSFGNSPFVSVEALELGTTQITSATVAQNACLRRAGSVCHTNLDCSPNKLHASMVDLFGEEYFGNAAEKAYWEESLICGQGELVPQIIENDIKRDDDRFDLYDLTQNRCCREIGKSLTIYSEDMSDQSFTINVDINNKTFDTTKLGYEYPTDAARYSRLASVDIKKMSADSSELSPGLSASTNATALGTDGDTLISLIEQYQWKTLSQAASNTCCGGGWVRKFADGSSDWSRGDRFKPNISNFKCLNYQSPLLLDSDPSTTFGQDATPYNYVDEDRRDGESNVFCLNDAAGSDSSAGCAQVPFLDSGAAGFDSASPTLDTTNAFVSVTFGSNFDRNVFNFSGTSAKFAPYSAVPTQSYDYFKDDAASPYDSTIGFQLPAYIPADFRAAVFNLEVVAPNGSNKATCVARPAGSGSIITASSFNPAGAGDAACSNSGGNVCEYCYYPNSGIMAISLDGSLAGDGDDDYVRISFSAPGTQHYQANAPGSSTYTSRSQTPGNYFYYLRRLGKFELSGIPQIYYEPLYCSDNYLKLVPGLFDSSLEDAADFAASSSTFTLPNGVNDTRLDTPNDRSSTPALPPASAVDGGAVATKDILENEDVFSGHEFRCCLKLGKNTTGNSLCCSGHAASDSTDLDGDGDTTELVCKLPSKANLSIYFNRFVSGEGVGSSLPGGGLSDGDFDANTGEPLMNSSVYNKLVALGNAYCASSTVRRGGAFGQFKGEPKLFGNADNSSSGGVWSLLDSINDSDTLSIETKGYTDFSEGYKWNHHLYCE